MDLVAGVLRSYVFDPEAQSQSSKRSRRLQFNSRSVFLELQHQASRRREPPESPGMMEQTIHSCCSPAHACPSAASSTRPYGHRLTAPVPATTMVTASKVSSSFLAAQSRHRWARSHREHCALAEYAG